MTTTPAKRKPNWSEGELHALSEGVLQNITIIKGQFGPSLTSKDKLACWEKIVTSVNAVNVSGCNRTVSEIKKKRQDLQGSTKKKEAARRSAAKETGGGPAPVSSLKSWENTIMQTLTRTQIEGIEGGSDSLSLTQTGTTLNEQAIYSFEDMPVMEGATVMLNINNDEFVIDNSSEGPANTNIGSTNSKQQKRSGQYNSTDEDVQTKFIKLEEEKEERRKEYRKTKLELMSRHAIACENILLEIRRITGYELNK